MAGFFFLLLKKYKFFKEGNCWHRQKVSTQQRQEGEGMGGAKGGLLQVVDTHSCEPQQALLFHSAQGRGSAGVLLGTAVSEHKVEWQKYDSWPVPRGSVSGMPNWFSAFELRSQGSPGEHRLGSPRNSQALALKGVRVEDRIEETKEIVRMESSRVLVDGELGSFIEGSDKAREQWKRVDIWSLGMFFLTSDLLSISIQSPSPSNPAPPVGATLRSY